MTKLYILPIAQVVGPALPNQEPEPALLNVPKYTDSALLNKSYVAFYISDTVLIATEQNDALEQFDDVISVSDKDAAVSSEDAQTLSASVPQIKGHGLNQPAQTYQQTMLAAAGVDQITLKLGSDDLSLEN